MQRANIVMLVVYILGLLIQMFVLAAKALFYKTYKSMDQHNGSTMYDSSQGYIMFGIVGGAISVLLYIYLIVATATGKGINKVVDYMLFQAVVMLQFAIGVVFAAELSNNQTSYDAALASLTTMELFGAVGQTVDDLKDFRTALALTKAACVLCLIIGFAVAIFAGAWAKSQEKEEGKVGSSTQMQGLAK